MRNAAIQQVSPAIRKRLVFLRDLAMKGHLDTVVAELHETLAQPTESSYCRYMIASTLAELLYADRQVYQSRDVLERFVVPLRHSLNSEANWAIDENATQIKMSLLEGDCTAELSAVADLRRAAGLAWYDTNDLLQIRTALEEEKYNRALEPIWRDLIKAYQIGAWRRFRWANISLGRVFAKLEAVLESVFYFIQGESPDEVDRVADLIIERRDRQLVSEVLRLIVTRCGLRRHFIVGARLLGRLNEYVADDSVDVVTDWLLARAREPIDNLGSDSASLVAWKQLKYFLPRSKPETAALAKQVLLASGPWNEALPEPPRVLTVRKHLLEAAASIVPLLSNQDAAELADAVLHLLKTRSQGYDYVSAVEVLVSVAGRGESQVNKTLRDYLYPGGAIANSVLAQFTEAFDVEPPTSDSLAKVGLHVLSDLHATIRSVGEGEDPPRLSEELYRYTSKRGDRKVVVVVQSGVTLMALVQHRHRLGRVLVTDLVDSMVRLVTHPDNLLSVKLRLVQVILEFADCLHESLCISVIGSLWGIASGEQDTVLENTLSSPFCFGATSEHLQGACLVAVAALSRGKPALEAKVEGLARELLVDFDPNLRKAAYMASSHLTNLSGESLLPILVGLRDSFPEGAAEAFNSIYQRSEWKFRRPQWKLFLLAVNYAAHSESIELRWHAARCLLSRVSEISDARLRTEADALISIFGRDVSLSVRALLAVR